jgi:hypothetical protein
MNTNTHSLVQKLWNYCNVLRDDGMSYGDYVEQLTYLLFLKMADERSRPPFNVDGRQPGITELAVQARTPEDERQPGWVGQVGQRQGSAGRAGCGGHPRRCRGGRQLHVGGDPGRAGAGDPLEADAA